MYGRSIHLVPQASEPSNSWEFIISIPPGIPPLVSPADGTLAETSVTPTFAWQGVENAARYEIQVDDSPSFNSVNYESQTTNTDIEPSDPLDQGSYYWRVRALNTYDTAGDWSPAWKVTVSIPPEAPELAAPSNESVFISNDRPSFTWQGVPNAEEYQVQVGNSETINTPVYEGTTSRTQHPAPSDLGQGEYYWRVRGSKIGMALTASGQVRPGSLSSAFHRAFQPWVPPRKAIWSSVRRQAFRGIKPAMRPTTSCR